MKTKLTIHNLQTKVVSTFFLNDLFDGFEMRVHRMMSGDCKYLSCTTVHEQKVLLTLKMFEDNLVLFEGLQ